jgi:hypothetical protein
VICPASIPGNTNPVDLDHHSAQQARLGSQRWTSEAQPNRASAGFPPVRAGPPKKNVSRRDAKTQRRGAKQHADAHRVLVFSLRLCVFARASLFSRKDAEVDGTMISTTLSAGKPAVRRQASIDQAWQRGTASEGFGKMRTLTHLGRNGSIPQPARPAKSGPAGKRDRCVPITFPVPFDATTAEIQKRDNTPRLAVIWLVHVVVIAPAPVAPDAREGVYRKP